MRRFLRLCFRVAAPGAGAEVGSECRPAVRPGQQLAVGVRAGTWTEAKGAASLQGERAATPCTGPRPGRGCAVPCLGTPANRT